MWAIPANSCALLSEEEKEFFSYSAASYIKLKDQYLSEQANYPAFVSG
jgi:hypothetical protein